MAKIAVVVGNGLSMSFGAFTGLSEAYNSQEPLTWNIKKPQTGNMWLDYFPRLKSVYNNNQGKSSFDILSLTLSKEHCKDIGIVQEHAKIEARHYLTISFSHYSDLQRRNFSTDWSWMKWFKLHKSDITAAYSLNYDLLLETMLDEIDIKYHSAQVNHKKRGIPLVKPHGSVDFDSYITYISTPNGLEYPLQNWVDQNNAEIIRIDYEQLLQPRKQAHCIIPTEQNKYVDYCWVNSAYREFHKAVMHLDYCVFIGVSYWKCDQIDLNKILKSIPQSCVIVIANPCPPTDFLKRIEGRPYIIWSNENGPVDENGNLLTLKCMMSGFKLPRCPCGSGVPRKYCHKCSVTETV